MTDFVHHDLCRAVSATITHDGYGCDTGCCGHRIHLWDDYGVKVGEVFSFDHRADGETDDAFVRRILEEEDIAVHEVDMSRCEIWACHDV